MSRLIPPPAVLAAFGVAGEPEPLDGGQGWSWLGDDLVLKPLDLNEAELAWQADLFDSIRCDGFRVARPRRARNGALVVEGWCAWERLEGRHQQRQWPKIIAVGERFHAALVGVPRPGFIDRRFHRWALGDRVAWGELSADQVGHVKHLPRLLARSARSRPRASSSTETSPAMCEDILTAVAGIEHFGQFLLRALIFRAVSDGLFREHEPAPRDADPYLPAVELACRLAAI